MESSKLIKLIEKLDGYQLHRLEDFLKSPYFNKNDHILQLFIVLKKAIEKGKKNKLEKQKLFKKLFPEQTFNNSKLNYFSNQLFQLVERFIVVDQESISDDLQLLHFYRQANLPKHYLQKSKQLDHRIQSVNQQGESFYYFQFEQSKIADQHFLQQGQRKYDQHIQDANHRLDHFYLIQKLKFYAEMLDREKKIPPSYQFTNLNLLDQLIENTKTQNNDYIQLYRKLIQMLQEESNTIFYEEYLKQLDQSKKVISDSDLKKLYFYAINYCVRKIAGGQRFHQNLLSLYMLGLEEGFLFQNGNQLSPWTFKNIVQLALALQQMEWTEQFIHQYAVHLPTAYQKDALHYNLAVLHYNQKAFDQAMYYLNQVNYTNLSFKLWSREMLLKIYYEEQEYEALHSLIVSFETLIRRNKTLPRNQKSAYANFLKITSKLLKKKRNIEKIKAEIKETPALRERKWLLEQCQKK